MGETQRVCGRVYETGGGRGRAWEGHTLGSTGRVRECVLAFVWGAPLLTFSPSVARAHCHCSLGIVSLFETQTYMHDRGSMGVSLCD